MNQDAKINRVVDAVLSLTSAAANYAVENEHHSMSGTYDEERELKEALKELLTSTEEEV